MTSRSASRMWGTPPPPRWAAMGGAQCAARPHACAHAAQTPMPSAQRAAHPMPTGSSWRCRARAGGARARWRGRAPQPWRAHRGATVAGEAGGAVHPGWGLVPCWAGLSGRREAGRGGQQATCDDTGSCAWQSTRQRIAGRAACAARALHLHVHPRFLPAASDPRSTLTRPPPLPCPPQHCVLFLAWLPYSDAPPSAVAAAAAGVGEGGAAGSGPAASTAAGASSSPAGQHAPSPSAAHSPPAGRASASASPAQEASSPPSSDPAARGTSACPAAAAAGQLPRPDRTMYAIHPIPLSDVRALTRHTPPLGWHYLVIVLVNGVTLPPMFFHQVGLWGRRSLFLGGGVDRRGRVRFALGLGRVTALPTGPVGVNGRWVGWVGSHWHPVYPALRPLTLALPGKTGGEPGVASGQVAGMGTSCRALGHRRAAALPLQQRPGRIPWGMLWPRC